ADEQADLAGAVPGRVHDAVPLAHEIAVAERAIHGDGTEPAPRASIEREQPLELAGGDARAAEEDLDVLGGDDDALVEAGEHARVELVHGEARARARAEIVRAAEVIDVRVRDDGGVHVLVARALAERGADRREAEREIAPRH